MGAMTESAGAGVRWIRRTVRAAAPAILALTVVVSGAVEAQANGVSPSPGETRMAPASETGVANARSAQGFMQGLRYRLTALGGVHGLGGEERHLYGGVEGGAFHGRFGAMGLGQYGNGGSRSSILVGGGPALEVLDLDRASLAGYAGVAWYRETLENPEASRRLTGPFGGVSLRVPLPVGSLGVGVSVWRGSASGGGIVEDASGTGRRLSVGFGL